MCPRELRKIWLLDDGSLFVQTAPLIQFQGNPARSSLKTNKSVRDTDFKLENLIIIEIPSVTRGAQNKHGG